MKYILLTLILFSQSIFAKDCKRLIELITTKKELVLIENALKIVEECRKEGLPYDDVSAILSQLYAHKQDIPNTIKWAEELMISTPKSITAHIMLCQAYNSKGDEDKALLHCKEALKDEGPYQALMYNLTGKWLFFKSSKTRNLTEALEARKYFVKSLEKAPAMVSSNYYIGLIEVIRKDYPLARLMFKKSCAENYKDSCKILENIPK